MQGKTISQIEADEMVEKYRQDVQRCVHPGFGEGIAAMDNAQMAIDAGQIPGKPYITGQASQRRYTRAEMHEKAASSESLAASRNLSAAQFLRAHPEFETFLDLIRDGAITLY